MDCDYCKGAGGETWLVSMALWLCDRCLESLRVDIREPAMNQLTIEGVV